MHGFASRRIVSVILLGVSACAAPPAVAAAVVGQVGGLAARRGALVADSPHAYAVPPWLMWCGLGLAALLMLAANRALRARTRTANRELLETNDELLEEVGRRRRAEEQLRQTNAALEERVHERAMAEDALRRRLALEEGLAKVSSRFAFASDADAAVEAALADIGALTSASRVMVYMLRDEAATIDCTSEWSAAGVEPIKRRFQGVPCSRYAWWMRQIMSGQIVRIDDPEALPPAAAAERMALRDHHVRFLIGFPIHIDATLAGFIVLANLAASPPPTSEDLDILRLAADIMGHAFERSRKEERHRRLIAAIEQAGEAIVIADAEAIIRYVNPAFTKITGYRFSEAVGQNPRLLKSNQHDADFYRTLWDTLTRGETWRGQFVNRRKDGSRYEEDAVISPVRDASGHNVSYVAVKRDITERKELEKQLFQAQKLEAVGQLAGGVAHDFNNLLMIMRTSAEFALDATADASPARPDIEEMLATCDRASVLTRQLLAFSRRQTLQPRECDLNAIIESARKMLIRILGENIELQFTPEPALGAVCVDPGAIEQVIVNLALNARDAMPHGGTLRFSTRNTTIVEEDLRQFSTGGGGHTGRASVLSVTDTGTGMAPEVKTRLFEPFFTTKGEGRGSGLGLATAYGIVKQHHGHISVYSEPGMGSTFSIYLPCSDGKTAPSSAPDTVHDGVPGGCERILVVEDDDGVRRALVRTLRKLGYTAFEADRPSAALAHMEAFAATIDVLLTDLGLPEMDGAALAQRIHAQWPHVRIVFTSGYPEDHGLNAHHVAMFAVPFLRKPFTVADVARILRTALDQPHPGGD